MEIFLIRHGQTKYNELNIANGLFDENLNEQGIFEANQLKKELKNVEFDYIYVSPLKRALDTAKIIKSSQQLIIDERLIERDLGEFTNKPINIEKRIEYWTYGYKCNYRMETLDEIFKRVYEFLDDIKKKHENEKILVVTHQGICRIIDCYFNGIPEDNDLMKISYKNCEIRKYGEKF